MKLSHWVRPCLMLVFPLGCGPIAEPYDDAQGNDRYPSGITNGTQTNAYPSVGYLTDGGTACSATLIGPRAVLTAAHCIESGRGKFHVGGQERPWSKAHVHAGYNGETLDNDLAVAILDSAVTSVDPSPLRTSAVSSGQAITLVGYGYTTFNGGNEEGKKYVGTNSISDVGSKWFKYRGNSNICSGDSGGPTFIGSQLAGVHSSGAGNDYCSRTGYDVRVDSHVDWIKSKAENGGDGGDGGGSGNAKVRVSKATYLPNEAIVVNFSNLPGNPRDWIGIYKVNAAERNYLTFKYTNGAKSGSLSFGGMQVGNYEARLFFSNSYNPKGQVPFKVKKRQ